MKSNWFMRGLLAGIQTERIPDGEVATDVSPGMPIATSFATSGQAAEIASRCPTQALIAESTEVAVESGRCVQCMRCTRGEPRQSWRHDIRWGTKTEAGELLPKAFARSLHVRIVDAGDCGACLNELAQMNGPAYNLHRFGIFITPTPRHADVLLVVGPVTAHMSGPLRTAYDAMPEPKRVVAVGVCAISGGIFGPSSMSKAGAADVVPVDIVVPGCPPPPLAIIDALRSVCGQVAISTANGAL